METHRICLCLKVNVVWSDGHASSYKSDWLLARSFDDANFDIRKLMTDGPKKILWGSEYQENIRYHDFDNVIKDDQALYSWLHGNLFLM